MAIRVIDFPTQGGEALAPDDISRLASISKISVVSAFSYLTNPAREVVCKACPLLRDERSYRSVWSSTLPVEKDGDVVGGHFRGYARQHAQFTVGIDALQVKVLSESGDHSFDNLSVFAQPAHDFAGLVAFGIARWRRDDFSAILTSPMSNPARSAEAAVSEIGQAAILSGAQGGADGLRAWDSASFICSVPGQFGLSQLLASLPAAHKGFHQPAVIKVCQPEHPAGDNTVIAGAEQQLLSVVPAAMIAAATFLSEEPMAIMADGLAQATMRRRRAIHHLVQSAAAEQLRQLLLQANKSSPQIPYPPIKLTALEHRWKP
ncbi:MAG: hypothetical protein OXI34_17855 [Chloroflexota bacterium]|nr:hypothetical protein [Chloroflexota bacterium]